MSEKGYTENVYKVVQVGSHYRMVDVHGEELGTLGVSTTTRKKAFNNQNALREYVGKGGKVQYRQVPMDEFTSKVIPMNQELDSDYVESPETIEDIRNFIHNESTDLKPDELFMSELNWKFLIRSAIRGKNIMMTGHSGAGKTLAALSLIKALNRPGFSFNLGSTQDARATLVGNTQYDPKKGTFFGTSAFVKAIQTPYSVILLDEITRAHPDAWNILMTVLDEKQRYMRLDEEDGSPTVEVAEGVTFIATANIGNEYTSTRVLDRAIQDRFVTIEMELLNEDDEYRLLKMLYPEVDDEKLAAVAEIAHYTRQKVEAETGEITTLISTRTSVEVAGLINDGFSLIESSEISIFPLFSKEGGDDSERTHIKQLVQKYAEVDDDNDPLFNTPDDDLKKDDTPW